MASPDQLALHPLPEIVSSFLDSRKAPPRLIAHLILVHDVAVQLIDFIRSQWPLIDLDAEAVLIGAAWHDIGKIKYPEELSGHGSQHEDAGLKLLLQAGIELRLARFAQTHGQWSTLPSISLEDLIVALADTCWKGKRDKPLEEQIVDILVNASRIDRWSIFLALDDKIEKLTTYANSRLAWQAKFPIARPTE
jgi:putative nucleotidyltransferase with HDIG domain